MAVKVTTQDEQVRILPEVSEVGNKISEEVFEERTRAVEAENLLGSTLLEIGNELDSLDKKLDSTSVDLQKKIDDERSRALESETSLETSITSLTSDLAQNLEQEIKDRESDISDVTSALSKEVERASQAEADNASAISSETARALEQENNLLGTIEQEISDRLSSISTLSSDIETASESLREDITTETTRAIRVENALSSSIEQEIKDRESEITRVESLISQGSTGSGPDLSPILARVTALEESDKTQDSDIVDLQAKNQSLENKVSALEEKDALQDSIINSAKISAQRAETTAQEAKNIAQERSQAKVFDTEEDMNAWLKDPNNTSDLAVGSALFIRALDEPDYWWDGEKALELETRKVDLSEYYTKDQTNTLVDVEKDRALLAESALNGALNEVSETLTESIISLRSDYESDIEDLHLEIQSTPKIVAGKQSLLEFDATYIPKKDTETFQINEISGYGVGDYGQRFTLRYKSDRLNQADEITTKYLTFTLPIDSEDLDISYPGNDIFDIRLRSIIKDKINGAIQQMQTPSILYGTDTGGNQKAVGYGQTSAGESIVQRKVDGNILVPETPHSDEDATSKKYVQDQISDLDKTKADKSGYFKDMTVGASNLATQLSTPRTINGFPFDGSSSINFYGACVSGSAVANKQVSTATSGFTLEAGVVLTVYFSQKNAVGTRTYLSIDNGSVNPIAVDGIVRNDLAWQAGDYITFVFTGTEWNIIGGYKLRNYPVGCLLVDFSGEITSPQNQLGGEWEVIASGTFIESAGSTGAITSKEAGLPNIEGHIDFRHMAGNSTLVGSGTGPFSGAQQASSTSWANGISSSSSNLKNDVLYFDASKPDDSLYGLSDTVQPKSVTARMWKRIA